VQLDKQIGIDRQAGVVRCLAAWSGTDGWSRRGNQDVWMDADADLDKRDGDADKT
jgi:hypothetical protein